PQSCQERGMKRGTKSKPPKKRSAKAISFRSGPPLRGHKIKRTSNARQGPREAGPLSSTTFKKGTTTIETNPPLPSLIEFVRIRDRLVIDAKLKAKLDKELAASGALLVTLIAR